MKIKRAVFLVGLALAISTWSIFADSKPLMAHYMPWFVAKPFSGSWGYHWTLGSTNYNPDQVDETGRRRIASHLYPLIGPYDSLDPAVLEYHVVLMKLAGIDGVIADWYGEEEFYDYGVINRRTLALANWARRAGLKFALCYEDRTVQAKIDGGKIPAASAITNAQATMLYAQTNFFADPLYLRLSSQPILLNFGPAFFKLNSQWVSIFSVLSNTPAFFTLDNKYNAGTGAFDWPPMWRSVDGVLSTESLNAYLDGFEASAKAWPAFVSSAFPRFYDFYAEAGLPAYGHLDDRGGRTFIDTLRRAITNNSAIVQLVTWNDFGEGTIIEPTLEYGYRDLAAIQQFRRDYLDSTFSGRTNDLALAFRLYTQRQQLGHEPVVAAELDRVFSNLTSQNVHAAELQLAALEANRPTFYTPSLDPNQFRAVLGGYLANGATVMESSDLVEWRTVKDFPASTNLTVFTTNLDSQDTPRFFKVQ